jgi:hypothetical protein
MINVYTLYPRDEFRNRYPVDLWGLDHGVVVSQPLCVVKFWGPRRRTVRGITDHWHDHHNCHGSLDDHHHAAVTARTHWQARPGS